MDSPEEIHGVSRSVFSVARHYGGCKVNGVFYLYDPERDVLVREDVVRARVRAEKAARKARRQAAAEAQGDLPGLEK